ncbi:MAG: phosphonate C-P lyase system protein PhnH [Methylotenera sp.]|nr:phosphonate C-P lyase system protein PhnH [Moraxellaceae bacterium]MDP1766182.1 phosphonate C-P lyase system protein PhnH [Methylotenera sp.]
MNNHLNTALQPTLPSIWQADTQQRAFRKIMNAFARPGAIEILEGETLESGALLLTLATLLDGATTLADFDGMLSEHDMARLEVATVAAEQARFVLTHGEAAPAFTPSLGTLESPDMGATILLKIQAIGSGHRLKLTGPGVDGACEVAVNGLHPAWIAAHQNWNSAFPLGVDFLLVAEHQVMALPRTTRIEEIK